MRSHPAADHRPADPANQYLAPLRRHAATVLRLFPNLREGDSRGSVASADALFVGYFLDLRPGECPALEMGPGTGATTLCLAAHPRVSKVVSVNPNPPVAGDPGWPGTLDVARAVTEEHPETGSRILFFEEDPVDGVPEAAREELTRDAEAGQPIALVVGLHSREDVAGCLRAVFDWNPGTVVLLGGCRGGVGPFVQAGAVNFLEQASGEYHFRLAGDLGPALAGSGFGVLYPGSLASEVEQTLEAVGCAFGLDLDPLRLLGRAEELNEAVGEVGRQRDHLERRISQLETETSGRESELERQVARLKNRNTALNARLSGRRYKAADAVVDRVLRLPMVRELLRGDAPPPGKG